MDNEWRIARLRLELNGCEADIVVTERRLASAFGSRRTELLAQLEKTQTRRKWARTELARLTAAPSPASR